MIHDGIVMTPNGEERIDIACKMVVLSRLRLETSVEPIEHYLQKFTCASRCCRFSFTSENCMTQGNLKVVHVVQYWVVSPVFEMPNTQPLTLWKDDLEEKLNALLEELGGLCFISVAHPLMLNNQNWNAYRRSGVKVFGQLFGDLLADEDEALRRILANAAVVSRYMQNEGRLVERKAIAREW